MSVTSKWLHLAAIMPAKTENSMAFLAKPGQVLIAVQKNASAKLRAKKPKGSFSRKTPKYPRQQSHNVANRCAMLDASLPCPLSSAV